MTFAKPVYKGEKVYRTGTDLLHCRDCDSLASHYARNRWSFDHKESDVYLCERHLNSAICREEIRGIGELPKYHEYRLALSKWSSQGSSGDQQALKI